MKSQRRRSITWPSVTNKPSYPRKPTPDKAAAPITKAPWPKIIDIYEPRHGQEKELQK